MLLGLIQIRKLLFASQQGVFEIPNMQNKPGNPGNLKRCVRSFIEEICLEFLV